MDDQSVQQIVGDTAAFRRMSVADLRQIAERSPDMAPELPQMATQLNQGNRRAGNTSMTPGGIRHTRFARISA